MTVASITVAFIALVWLMDRREQRHHADRDRVLDLLHTERLAMEAARERATPELAPLIALVEKLCQRLQAPEWAVQEHRFAQADGAPAPQPPLTDEDWWDARQVLPKEELAEQLWQQELSARESAAAD